MEWDNRYKQTCMHRPRVRCVSAEGIWVLVVSHPPMHRLHAGKVRAKQNCSTQCLKRWSFFFISRSLCQSLYWCLLRWRARWSDLAKAFSQWGHLNGFIPVCFRMWRVSSSDLANFQVQPSQVHLYGFSPVWVRWWAFRCELLVYTLLHPG